MNILNANIWNFCKDMAIIESDISDYFVIIKNSNDYIYKMMNEYEI